MLKSLTARYCYSRRDPQAGVEKSRTFTVWESHTAHRKKISQSALMFSTIANFIARTAWTSRSCSGQSYVCYCQSRPDEELMPHFVRDIQEIRQRAIHKMEDGAVTESYKGDVNKTIEILNEALATEIVCVLRYMHHYFMATGVHGKAVSEEFKEHADEEREHADMIAERIQQLGGKPDFNPKTLLERSVSHYIEGETLEDMIKEDLIAERVVIDVYQRMIEYFGHSDPTTRRMIEHIKAEEEEHASDLSDLMFIVNPHTGKDEGED